VNENGPAVVTRAGPPAAFGGEGGGAVGPAGRPEIARALSQAQQKCRAVEKDGWNAFHRYHYASSESIIAEAKDALADSGLALIPLEQTIDGHEKTGEARFELRRRFCLLHSSGEWLPINVAWPVCPEKGRPLDKAAAIAATQSLAYLLRDLLLMPRVEAEDDMAGRQDRHPPAPTPPPTPAQPAAAKAPPGDAAPEPMRAEQEERLDRLLRDLGISEPQFADWIARRFGDGDWRKLSAEQASRVITGLEAQKEKKASQTAGAKSE
jgi:pyruvate/2-oxoglutarate dehydrogenase complex dihydrolipoamide acyltransferase (E2) component